MYGTGIVRKLDNGYRGVFENTSERGLWSKGEEIFNRQLHDFPKGTLMRVLISFSPKGRKMVKKVELFKAPEMPEVEVEIETLEPETLEPLVDYDKVEKEKVDAPNTPAPGSGYYVGPEERLIFNTVLGMSLVHPEKPVKVMMVGPSGYGKTSLPKLFAELCGKKYLRMNCATVRDPEEWFGFREARDGSTVFVRSQFASLLEEGNAVVVLDEFNRLEPWLHNTLFPLLDDDGCTVVHEEKFSIGPGVIVVGTINSGYKYTGTFELDEALLNRFEFILEVGPMPFAEEISVLTARTGIDRDTASRVVKVASILRQNEIVCSTRTTLLVANMVVSGLRPREAFETAVVKRVPADASGSALRKQIVDLINVELGPMEERSLDLDIFNLGATVAKVAETRHMVTLYVSDKAKTQMLRLVQLVKALPVTGAKLSLVRASNLVREMLDGGTVVLDLEEEPLSVAEFAEVGVSVRYSAVSA